MRKIFCIISIILFPTICLAENLLTNPGFDVEETFRGWNVWGEEKDGQSVSGAEVTKSISRTPPCSAKLWAWKNVEDAGAGIWQDFNVQPGKTYYAAAFLKSLPKEPLKENIAHAWVSLEWYDKNGNIIGHQIDTKNLVECYKMWAIFKLSAQAPPNAVKGRILCRLWAAGGKAGKEAHAVYIDNVQVSSYPILFR